MISSCGNGLVNTWVIIVHDFGWDTDYFSPSSPSNSVHPASPAHLDRLLTNLLIINVRTGPVKNNYERSPAFPGSLKPVYAYARASKVLHFFEIILWCLYIGAVSHLSRYWGIPNAPVNSLKRSLMLICWLCTLYIVYIERNFYLLEKWKAWVVTSKKGPNFTTAVLRNWQRHSTEHVTI